MTTTPSWEILDGLPVYGPPAENFSATGHGAHREGLVIRFSPSAGSWIGNFQRGNGSRDEVFLHPDGRHVIVVAGGTAYLVDVEARRLVTVLDVQVEQVLPLPARATVLLGNGRWFEAGKYPPAKPGALVM